jgi:hypothetical protein
MSKLNEPSDQASRKSGRPPKDAQATRKEKAILALMQQPTVEKAAEVAGVHPATLYRWRKDPEFQKALLAARREAFFQAIGRLQQASAPAMAAVLRILTDGQVPASTRLQAARCVLEQSFKGFENEDMLVRLTELENRMAPTEPSNSIRQGRRG